MLYLNADITEKGQILGIGEEDREKLVTAITFANKQLIRQAKLERKEENKKLSELKLRSFSGETPNLRNDEASYEEKKRASLLTEKEEELEYE